jgi:transposase
VRAKLSRAWTAASLTFRLTVRTSIPIEKAFSKVKAILRKAAARTLEELWAAIRTALTAFTPGECANYFAACGYNPA